MFSIKVFFVNILIKLGFNKGNCLQKCVLYVAAFQSLLLKMWHILVLYLILLLWCVKQWSKKITETQRSQLARTLST